VKREFQSYLVPTLQSVFDNMSQVIFHFWLLPFPLSRVQSSCFFLIGSSGEISFKRIRHFFIQKTFENFKASQALVNFRFPHVGSKTCEICRRFRVFIQPEFKFFEEYLSFSQFAHIWNKCDNLLPILSNSRCVNWFKEFMSCTYFSL
jgi:hypothetical protein